MQPAAPTRATTPQRLALLLAIAAYLTVALWHVLHGALNPDEGFYAIATRSVAMGEMPYRDFGFTQPPLLPYVNSVLMRCIGFGLFEQRFTNGLWAALAVGLAARWLWRQSGPWFSFVLIAGCALSAPWLYFMHLGKTYALTGLLVMLSAWVFLRVPTGAGRLFLLGLLAVLGTGTRLPAGPFLFALWIFAHWPGRHPSPRELVASAIGLALGALLVVLPFSQAAPEAAWFWVFDFHRLSVPNKSWHLHWQEIVSLAPGIWALAALALLAAWRHCHSMPRVFLVMAASLLALGCNLLPGGVYEEYGTPFLLPLFTAGLAALKAGVVAWPKWRVAAIVVLTAVAQLATAPLLFSNALPQRRGTASMWLTYNAPAYNPDLPGQLAAARQVIAQSLAPDAPFVGPQLILAAETGRTVPPEFRMGSFTLTAEMPAARAAKLHLATPDRLESWLADRRVTALAFFTQSTLNYGWSMPSFENIPAEARQRHRETYRRDFPLVWQEGQFLILCRPSATPSSPP